MILQLTENTSRIGIRIKSTISSQYLVDWQGIALGITPGERNCDCCHEGGSPWYVWGCWMGHRTGVDLMNPPKPDFPAFFIYASELTDKNLVMFTLPDRWRKTVPFGRYTGFIRYQPLAPCEAPINARINLSEAPVPRDPGCYDFDPGPCYVKIPELKPCVLAEFDVDYGPRCSQHIIDRIDVELTNE